MYAVPTSCIDSMTAGWCVKTDATPAARTRIHSQHPMMSPTISVAARALPSESAVAMVHVKSGPGLMIRASEPMM